jgi:hypothetical protein
LIRLGAKIGSHEQDAVVDRVEDGVKLLIRLRKRSTAGNGGLPTPARRRRFTVTRCNQPPHPKSAAHELNTRIGPKAKTPTMMPTTSLRAARIRVRF